MAAICLGLNVLIDHFDRNHFVHCFLVENTQGSLILIATALRKPFWVKKRLPIRENTTKYYVIFKKIKISISVG